MDDASNTFTFYFLLLISIVMMIVNVLDLISIIEVWRDSSSMNPRYYESCVHHQLISKTVFSVFSLMTSVSLCVLCMLLMVDLDLFINKFFKPYTQAVCYVFGPCMLFFSILGFIFWNQVTYYCTGDDNGLSMSASSSISIIICFLISLACTVGYGLYEVFSGTINSILYRNEGSKVVSKLFWGAVYKKRLEEDNRIISARQASNS